MRVRTMFEKINEMTITVTATGTVAEFELILNNIERSYISPMSDFVEAIKDSISIAKRNIETEITAKQ